MFFIEDQMAFPGFLKRLKKVAGGVVKVAQGVNTAYKKFKPLVNAAVSSIPVVGGAVASGLDWASGMADKALPYAQKAVDWIPEDQEQWDSRRDKIMEFNERERARRQLM